MKILSVKGGSGSVDSLLIPLANRAALPWSILCLVGARRGTTCSRRLTSICWKTVIVCEYVRAGVSCHLPESCHNKNANLWCLQCKSHLFRSAAYEYQVT